MILCWLAVMRMFSINTQAVAYNMINIYYRKSVLIW
jgi:hypothetical protein